MASVEVVSDFFAPQSQGNPTPMLQVSFRRSSNVWLGMSLLALGSLSCAPVSKPISPPNSIHTQHRDEPPSRKPSTAQILRECIDAVHSGTDASTAAARCGRLFARKKCRDAQLSFDTPPLPERAATLIEVCASDYCPTLPEPRPRICAATEPKQAPSELAALWRELQEAVWRKELGPEASQRLHDAWLTSKAGVRSRSEALAFALCAGLFKPENPEVATQYGDRLSVNADLAGRLLTIHASEGVCGVETSDASGQLRVLIATSGTGWKPQVALQFRYDPTSNTVALQATKPLERADLDSEHSWRLRDGGTVTIARTRDAY